MAYAEGQLSGSRDFRVAINVNYSGVQDWGNNTSRFDWSVSLIDAARWGSWTNDTQYWSASIGGVNYSGTFTIPQSTAGQYSRVVGSGSTWHGHDGQGYRGGFPSTASISTNHANIGSGTTGQAWVDAPRIPIAPAAPGAPVVSNLNPTSMTLSWSGTPDNGGAGIDQYLLRVSKNNPADQSPWTDYPLSGSTFSHTVTGLTPGTQYYAVVYAHNSRGYSPKSAQTAVKTLSGAYVRRGTEWRPTELLVRKDGRWVPGETFVYRSGAWKAAS